MVNQKIFAKRLRNLRNVHEYSQKYVAEQIGCRPSTITNLERGNSSPSLDMVIKLATFYEVTVDYLVGLSDFPHPISNKVTAAINQIENPEEVIEFLQNTIKEEDPNYKKVKNLLKDLDDDSIIELKKYLQYLHIRQILDAGHNPIPSGESKEKLRL
ncbi:helix-turn-helix transcriptional regulator [Thermosyntropha sp.]|uniref:helix-turn-helix domain-containing protein n=1 Tax=Thermosyntropha sp. TaxID=2740820 RepID=UPI0025F0C82D|nr:helix-turn-helix transcriptional regulator [Thermosyntropha sp.]MBO8158130.1 helix-turn-helix transcriptional regulator [Thermosyntropha sp.]